MFQKLGNRIINIARVLQFEYLPATEHARAELRVYLGTHTHYSVYGDEAVSAWRDLCAKMADE